MKISLNWLSDYLDLGGHSAEKLAEKLTMATAEVEGVERVGEEYDHIVAGSIVELRPHPRSQGLSLTKVDVGSEGVDIVCGASNIEVGQMVPVALPGIRLPGGSTVERKDIGGVASNGVLCSARDLALTADHSGIMVLPAHAVPGQPLAEVLKLGDHVLEIDNKSLTHRPDLWGHYGIARELAAVLGRPLARLDCETEFGGEDTVKVTILDERYCRRYTLLHFDGIVIDESPYWMQHRLRNVGVVPHNNIVDLTNYVMLEVGNPVHAFDSRAIAGGEIYVRCAADGEKLVTLDGIERTLTSDMLLIAGRDEPLALGGVIGGKDSEVKEDSTSIMLESANFDAANVRRTSTALKLRTEAAIRFEKGLAPQLAFQAACRFARGLKEICPGSRVLNRLCDVGSYPRARPDISIKPVEVRRRLGASIRTDRIKRILESLEFGVVEAKGVLRVSVPEHRTSRDISIPEDLIEEVGRMYGFDNIRPQYPQAAFTVPVKSPSFILERSMKEHLSTGPGFAEVYTYSFYDNSVLSKLGLDVSRAPRLVNPMSQVQDKLRTSLIPNLLVCVGENLRFVDSVRIYEIGRVYEYESEGRDAIAQGKVASGLICRPVDEDERPGALFYEVKGAISWLLEKLDYTEPDFCPIEAEPDPRLKGVLGPWLDSSRLCAVKLDGVPLGVVGEVSSGILKALEIKEGAALFDINLDRLLEAEKRTRIFEPLPIYPSIPLDLSVVVEVGVPMRDVESTVREAGGELISDVEFFGDFEGEPIPRGKKSLSFHVTLQSKRRTLQQSDTQMVLSRIRDGLRSIGAGLRESGVRENGPED